MNASFLEVDVAAIRRNYRRLRDLAGPQTRICPVIKGNAYGMGATEVGRVLQQAGASMLAVYDANEGLAVLQAGIRCPILVLGPDRVQMQHSDLELPRSVCPRMIRLVDNVTPLFTEGGFNVT